MPSVGSFYNQARVRRDDHHLKDLKAELIPKSLSLIFKLACLILNKQESDLH
jgi:hypothetical protein